MNDPMAGASILPDDHRVRFEPGIGNWRVLALRGCRLGGAPLGHRTESCPDRDPRHRA